jgi:hypothetical protein
MSSIPEPQALADALTPCFDGRRVEAAVFTSYTFEPDFFELYILPVLLPRLQLSPVDATALWQLEDAFKTAIGDVAVYYDRRALLPRERPARLDVRRIPCTVRTGYFHPKVLLAVTEPDEPDTGESAQLVVMVSSANLTKAGWWENVEVAHIEVVDRGGLCSFRKDLLHLLKGIRGAAPAGTEHEALDRVRNFVRGLRERKHATASGVLHPRIFAGQEALAAWLPPLVPRSAERLSLEVISPYFDETAAGPLKALVDELHPAETRVFLPEGIDGRAACSSDYYSAVHAIPGVTWAKLPSSLLSFGRGEGFKQRPVHAKVYRLFDRRRSYEAQLVGSVNLTSAGHNRGGNLEAAFLVEREARSLQWYLESLVDEPRLFAEQSAEELEPQPTARLAVRFNWLTSTGEVFWDDPRPSGQLEVTAKGAPLFVLDGLSAREWVSLTAKDTELLADRLRNTSFLLVREPAGEYTVLVDESGMAGKPSIRHELTVADILKSWSLFTPEQRSAFIEERGRDLAETLRELGFDPADRGVSPESFFDLHAGIFLAFGNLERRLAKALAEGRDREVEYWLLGRQYDSLPTLLDRARSEAAGEVQPVREYLMLLCTKQLVEAVLASHPKLRERYPAGLADIRGILATLPDIRARFHFGTDDDRDRFFAWFERWFLQRATPVEVA